MTTCTILFYSILLYSILISIISIVSSLPPSPINGVVQMSLYFHYSTGFANVSYVSFLNQYQASVLQRVVYSADYKACLAYLSAGIFH